MLMAEIRANKSRHTKEDKFIITKQRERDLEPNSAGAGLFTVNPRTILHAIDQCSLLWGLSAGPLQDESFEMVGRDSRAMIQASIQSLAKIVGQL